MQCQDRALHSAREGKYLRHSGSTTSLMLASNITSESMWSAAAKPNDTKHFSMGDHTAHAQLATLGTHEVAENKHSLETRHLVAVGIGRKMLVHL